MNLDTIYWEDKMKTDRIVPENIDEIVAFVGRVIPIGTQHPISFTYSPSDIEELILDKSVSFINSAVKIFHEKETIYEF